MTTKPIDLARLTSPIPQIETYLEKNCIPFAVPPSQPTQNAMRYAVLQGGKRLRPLIAWYACEAVGAPGEASLIAGAAVELVHAFSLVHDDLPALDNDDLRRGKPTLHKHAGEAMAILAGDALMNAAYAHLAQGDNPALSIKLIRDLSMATHAMICGQVHDTLGTFNSGLGSEYWLMYIHHNKTGWLINAASMMGATCGLAHLGKLDEAKSSEGSAYSALLNYGAAIGVMFQIVDDLLDVTQTAESTGKRTGKDQLAGKLTYPGVHGIDATRREIEKLRSHALDSLAPLGPPAQPLRDLCEYLATRTS